MARNVVHLESSGGGVIGRFTAPQQTLHRAAEATLARGYTHFVLTDASQRSDTYYAGSTPGHLTVLGNTATYRPGAPIYGSDNSLGVTVVMYHAGDPQARNALDARQVLSGR